MRDNEVKQIWFLVEEELAAYDDAIDKLERYKHLAEHKAYADTGAHEKHRERQLQLPHSCGGRI